MKTRSAAEIQLPNNFAPSLVKNNSMFPGSMTAKGSQAIKFAEEPLTFGYKMLSLNSSFFAAGIFAVLFGVIGCAEPDKSDGDEPVVVVDLPEADLSPLDPENTLVLRVTAVPNEVVDFSVYVGLKVSDESRVPAISEDELADHICDAVDDELAANSDLDAVLIECDGSIKTGDVEFVKRAVARSAGASSLRIFIGVQDSDGSAAEDQED